ncbi:MAG: DUF1579 domain-containing protein [Candidatus Eisenbacteria bacterium]
MVRTTFHFTLRLLLLVTLCLASTSTPARAQGRPDPAVTIAAQREAMTVLAKMDGVWRGIAWTILPNGEKHEITQTERIGPFLDGSVRVIEGRGYEADGKVAFNAFGIVSFNPATKGYTMHSYAMGQVGDFTFTPTADGYAWEIPAGPMTIKYAATIKDGVLHEVGDRVMPGKDPVRFFEMTLHRVGDTDWPAAGAVSAK